jgi:myo-inositol 2-dehydrogenase/D-chiro-inositol 1-dehydrogenase
VSRLRVGCIGTGFIAGQHLAALAGFADVEIVAVAGTARDRAEDVAERYAARAYDDGSALLETEELDAVWLCVPPFAHGPLEDAAIDRGLPLFVEKPLAHDLPTAARLATRIRERGLLSCVGYHWRSLGVVEQAAQVLRDAPAQLVAGAWLDRTPAAPWWSQRSRSGGQLVEQTTHLVDLARLLLGDVDTVQALESTVAREAWPAADVPTASAVLLSFSSGAIGTISSSCVLDRRHSVGLQLVAQGRLVSLGEVGLYDHELRIADREGEHVVQSNENPIAREDRSFVDALRGAGPVPVSYEQALRTHAVVCAADRSARDGGVPVHVDSYLAQQTPPAGAIRG